MSGDDLVGVVFLKRYRGDFAVEHRVFRDDRGLRSMSVPETVETRLWDSEPVGEQMQEALRRGDRDVWDEWTFRRVYREFHAEAAPCGAD